MWTFISIFQFNEPIKIYWTAINVNTRSLSALTCVIELLFLFCFVCNKISFNTICRSWSGHFTPAFHILVWYFSMHVYFRTHWKTQNRIFRMHRMHFFLSTIQILLKVCHQYFLPTNLMLNPCWIDLKSFSRLLYGLFVLSGSCFRQFQIFFSIRVTSSFIHILHKIIYLTYINYKTVGFAVVTS